eukprot:1160405-Pelagomonas_calceolata.AAC.7
MLPRLPGLIRLAVAGMRHDCVHSKKKWCSGAQNIQHTTHLATVLKNMNHSTNCGCTPAQAPNELQVVVEAEQPAQAGMHDDGVNRRAIRAVDA